jgi:hypothetical protein
MGITITESLGSKGCLEEKEFQTKHQLLTWRQYAIVEHHWYKIHDMDLEQKTILVERLDSEDDGASTNGRIVNLVRRSAVAAARDSKRRRRRRN